MIELKKPAAVIRGAVQLSGSKSISNRLLVLDKVLNAGLRLNNLSEAEDTRLLQKALAQLNHPEKATIDVNHAGTDFRFLTALLSVSDGEWLLTGSHRLQERPVGPLVTALRELGAEIRHTQVSGYPPLRIRGRVLSGGMVRIDAGISSQFISALLLISPKFEKGLEIRLEGQKVSAPYLEMTIALLRSFGVEIEADESSIKVFPKPVISVPETFEIESDWSSASYYYSICALSPGCGIRIGSLSRESLQADAVLPDLYQQLGVGTQFEKNAVILKHTGTKNRHFECDFTNCPDIAQTVAVTCFGLGMTARLTGLRTLRIKETDRIEALKNELNKLGATVEAGDDHIFLQGRIKEDTGPVIATYHDHRMAMSFAPLALMCSSIRIEDELVVQKSYPRFWDDLVSLGFSVNLQP